MRTNFTSLIFAALCSTSALAQNFAWVKPTAATSRCVITRDANANIITSGSFSGTYDFDSGANNYELTSSPAGNVNQYVQKLDADGNLIWAKSFPGNYYNLLRSIVTDETGGIYHTGELSGTADFNPGTATNNVQGPCYIAKLNSDGSFAWAFRIGGNQAIGNQLLVADQSIYLCGSFSGTVDFDPSAQTFTLTSGNSGAQLTGFVARYNLQGQFISAFKVAGSQSTNVLNIRSKTNGNLVLYGYNANGVLSDGNNGNVPIYGGGDYFFGEYQSDGATVWAKAIGSVNYDVLGSLCLDANDNIIIQGTADGTTFDVNPGTPQTFIDGSFLAKYDTTGNYIWAKTFPGVFREYGVVADASGSVYAAGLVTTVDVDLDPGPGSFLISSNSGKCYIVKLDSNGNFTWGYAGPNWHQSTTVNLIENLFVSQNGELVSSNHFEDAFDFDPGANQAILNGGSSGGYIMKFLPDTMGIPENEIAPTLSWQSQSGVVSFKSESETNVEIFNALGKKMISFELSAANDFRFSCDRFPTGIYLVRSVENGKLFRIKILVK